MGRCLWCGREGTSIRVDAAGVCVECQPQVAMRAIPGSERLPDKISGAVRSLVRWNMVQRHAHEVTRLDRESRSAREGQQPQILRAYLESRDRLVHRDLRDEVDRLMSRAEAAPSVREAVSLAQKALEHIQVVRQAAPESGAVREVELKVRNFINHVQYESFLKKAEAAEAAGELRNAIAQYRGALFFLLTDEIDDRAQRGQISMIKEKVQALMARVR